MARNVTVTFEDGSQHVYQGAPDDVTPDAIQARAAKEFGKAVTALDGGRGKSPTVGELFKRELMTSPPMAVARGIKDLIDTGAQGAAWLYDKATGADKPTLSSLVTGQPQGEAARVAAMNKAGRAEFDAAAEGKFLPHVSRFMGNVAAAGPLVKGAGALVGTVAPRLGASIVSSGMTTGAAPVSMAAKAGDLAIRSAGGGAAGALSAGAVNPEDAKTGGMIGASLPPALAAGGKVGQKIGGALRQSVTPEVAALASRAKELGIDIPADRLVNSRPLNAVAAGLNYTPFSGRAATEARMGEQLNRAASRLIGQDSPNMMQALRKAGDDLGAKFDVTLKQTGVAFDKQMLDDVSRVFNTAERELGSDGLKPIASQVDELMAKAGSGVIDGQAAYNIKRTLDRIGRSNRPEAFHALELKGVLLDALNRSLGPDGAKAFAATRQQYGNMLSLEKLARNGVEGEISVARLANLGNINNKPLQELADIAAQFVKPREGQHGAAQRALIGVGAGVVGGPASLAGGVAVGRGMNSLLNSNALRNQMLGGPSNALMDPALQGLYRTAPLIAGGR